MGISEEEIRRWQQLMGSIELCGKPINTPCYSVGFLCNKDKGHEDACGVVANWRTFASRLLEAWNEANTWRSGEPPEGKDRVLVCWKSCLPPGKRVDILFRAPWNQWDDGHRSYDWNPNWHWMPLPSPPV